MKMIDHFACDWNWSTWSIIWSDITSSNHIDDILEFYIFDNFEKDRLILHREIVRDAMKARLGRKPENLNDFWWFLRNNLNIINVIPEFIRLIRIILTIPEGVQQLYYNQMYIVKNKINCIQSQSQSTATCERSYLALCRLKDFLRNSVNAEHLNNVAIMNMHKNINVNLDKLLNDFILKCSIRKSTFAIN